MAKFSPKFSRNNERTHSSTVRQQLIGSRSRNSVSCSLFELRSSNTTEQTQLCNASCNMTWCHLAYHQADHKTGETRSFVGFDRWVSQVDADRLRCFFYCPVRGRVRSISGADERSSIRALESSKFEIRNCPENCPNSVWPLLDGNSICRRRISPLAVFAPVAKLVCIF